MRSFNAAGLGLALAIGLAVPQGHAQLGSTAKAVHISPRAAATFSKQIEDDLASKGVRVAMVYRAGRPRAALPKGLSYTHGAFWVYQDLKTADGRIIHGYAVYNLYQGDGKEMPRDRSHLVQDFPLDFAAGSAIDEVAVIVPTPEMQRRILGVMGSDTYERLHNPAYSLVGNPLQTRYQNCNGFMLNVIAAAAWQTDDPRQIQANIRAHFKPSRVDSGVLMRVFAPAFDSSIKLDDQSRNRVVTVAYESIVAFMKENRLMDSTYVIRRKT